MSDTTAQGRAQETLRTKDMQMSNAKIQVMTAQVQSSKLKVQNHSFKFKVFSFLSLLIS